MAAVFAAQRKQREHDAQRVKVDLNELELLQDEGRMRMPDEARVLKQAVLAKKVTGRIIDWQPRLIMLTSSYLAIGRSDDEGCGRFQRDPSAGSSSAISRIMMQHVPLHEVIAVRNVVEEKKVKKKMLTPEQLALAHVQGQKSVHMSKEPKKWSDDENAFLIGTQPDGHNGGRPLVLRAESPGERDAWVQALNEAVREAIIDFQKNVEATYATSCGKKMSIRAGYLRHSKWWESLSALLVCGSFAGDILMAEWENAEFENEKNRERMMLAVLMADVFVTIFFLFEFAVNYVTHWEHFWTWIKKPWTILDIFINVLSVTSFVLKYDSLGMLRPIRIFRVVRLFRSWRSLNRITSALGKSLASVSSALGLLVLTQMGFAVLATQLFSDINQEYFRDFSTSMFSMFQACWDPWSIVRTLFANLDTTGENKTDKATAAFFVLYVLVTTVILINVVIAVLLDEFIECISRQKEKQAAQLAKDKELALAAVRIKGSMDPLLMSLSQFTTQEDLLKKIETLFQTLDRDSSGSIGYHELQQSLKELDLSPPIIVHEDDYDVLTMGSTLCDDDGEFDHKQFQWIMEAEMKRYAMRELSVAMNEGDKQIAQMCLVLKLLFFSVDDAHTKLDKLLHPGEKGGGGFHLHVKEGADLVFELLDPNGNGIITQKEYSRGFDLLDKNHNGFLTRKEFGNPSNVTAKLFFDLLDTDGDGNLSREEYEAGFALIDVDHDGKIDKEEFKQLIRPEEFHLSVDDTQTQLDSNLTPGGGGRGDGGERGGGEGGG
jgi:voltage-gated sodium channel